METIIDRVAAAAGHFAGHGDGPGWGPFEAAFEVRALLDGMGAEIVYVATDAAGAVLHSERTVLAFDMWSGEPTLYVLCRELSGLGQLTLHSESTFSNGAGIDSFEVQIELTIDDGDLGYVWSWGAPGEQLTEQSRATARRRPDPAT